MASRNASRTVSDAVVPLATGSAAGFSSTATGAGPAAADSGFAAASDVVAVSGASGAAAAGVAAARSSALSPSSSNMAMVVLTLTFSLPAATRMRPILPSSKASTSIVALSVSISAITSPLRTSVPSSTSHFDNVPSSIVGDSAGILISTAMISPPRLPHRRSAA